VSDVSSVELCCHVDPQERLEVQNNSGPTRAQLARQRTYQSLSSLSPLRRGRRVPSRRQHAIQLWHNQRRAHAPTPPVARRGLPALPGTPPHSEHACSISSRIAASV
jgi:hypothetical protein